MAEEEFLAMQIAYLHSAAAPPTAQRRSWTDPRGLTPKQAAWRGSRGGASLDRDEWVRAEMRSSRAGSAVTLGSVGEEPDASERMLRRLRHRNAQLEEALKLKTREVCVCVCVCRAS